MSGATSSATDAARDHETVTIRVPRWLARDLARDATQSVRVSLLRARIVDDLGRKAEEIAAAAEWGGVVASCGAALEAVYVTECTLCTGAVLPGASCAYCGRLAR